MKNFKATSLACTVLALAGLPLAAQADDSTHVGVAATAGLSGLGADLGVNINDYLGVRATAAGYSINRDGNFGTSVDWNGSLRLFQAGLLLDGYPFAGVFHVTAGVVHDGNRATANGRPQAGATYTFNGNTYSASEVGSASMSVDWGKTVPYLGLGWGNLSGSAGLHFTSDFGVILSGSPTAAVNVSCTASTSICTQMATDVAAEQTKLQNDVHKISAWPVIRFGIGYAF
jgi:hypothetical protein